MPSRKTQEVDKLLELANFLDDKSVPRDSESSGDGTDNKSPCPGMHSMSSPLLTSQQECVVGSSYLALSHDIGALLSVLACCRRLEVNDIRYGIL